MNEETTSRLSALRSAMKEQNIDAVIIPKTDPHQSEYLAEHWQVIRWLTGFTGSAGTVVVTHDKALFWTDSRYFIQAAQQLADTPYKLMKDGLPETPSINDFIIDALAKGDTVGIDGMLFSVNGARELERVLNAHGINLAVDFDPIDAMWTDRPTLPSEKLFIHEMKYAGESAADKIAKVLDEVRLQGANQIFLADLAEIAWILNIRCNDVMCNPVATAYLLLSTEKSYLFINPMKVDEELQRYLSSLNIEVMPYDTVKSKIMELTEEDKVLVSPTTGAIAFIQLLGDKAIEGTSPVSNLKSIKNETQIQGIRNAMERDGVALVKSMMEIEEKLDKGQKVTEIDVAEILTKHRSQQPLYYDDSFETIAGYGAHGAIVHYSATLESNVEIHRDNLLLIDSGANYLDGTTDITRTIALGSSTPEQRRDFTLVMKGHIALARAVYPEGTRGVQLDVLARQFLWSEGLTYLHGTGHGVGHFLNVHEGPQSIRMNDTGASLLPGMVTSNEPGLYRTDLWGIRCENLVLTVTAMTTEFGSFLKFETLTLFPFDRNLFERSMMSNEEIKWVDDYHKEVFDRLSPYLDEMERAWLREKTAPLFA